jgi:hypothetical protein
MEKVVEINVLLYPGLNFVLLADQNGPHQYGPAILALLRAGHRCMLLPPGCTAFAQPLDRAAFSVFKNNLVNVYRMAGRTPSSNADLVPIVVKAVQQSFSRASVQKSWADAGLFPLDEQRLISNAQRSVQASASTPGLTSEQLAAAAVFQHAREVTPRGAVRKGRGNVQRNRVYTDYELVELFEKYEEEKAAKEALKKERARAKAVRAAKGKAKKAVKRGESRAAKRRRGTVAAVRHVD